MPVCLAKNSRNLLPNVKPHSIRLVSNVSSVTVFLIFLFFFIGKIFSPEKYALITLFSSILLLGALRLCFLHISIKKNPKNYVMLYMGILPEHKGLGSALCNSILEELKEKNIPSIGALAHDGKKTQNYASDCIEDRYEYVLLKKKL